MAPLQPRPTDCCPHCGAVRKPDRAICWLCCAALPRPGTGGAVFEDVAAAWQPPRLEPPAGPFQYGLSSLFLITTLGAILCSIFVMAPGLGIAVAILATPALIWTIVAAERRGRHGEPMSAGRKTATFVLVLLSIFGGIVLVIGAFLMAMFATCMMADGSHLAGPDAALGLSLVLGGIAALFVGIGYIWVIRHRMRRKTRRW